jgi:hypothetical protein
MTVRYLPDAGTAYAANLLDVSRHTRRTIFDKSPGGVSDQQTAGTDPAMT